MIDTTDQKLTQTDNSDSAEVPSEDSSSFFQSRQNMKLDQIVTPNRRVCL